MLTVVWRLRCSTEQHETSVQGVVAQLAASGVLGDDINNVLLAGVNVGDDANAKDAVLAAVLSNVLLGGNNNIDPATLKLLQRNPGLQKILSGKKLYKKNQYLVH